ncbi:helix-turn-helix transcriptional regulator [Streptomyces sp. NBC_00536]|uniref:helix-turn-helix transcriptional regulator n=1 Tax=Streptomyces sp. NBC_00536 TaxID=2975769 RepID=UPI002E816BD3|nr:helix-turn-helix transcriptional regulator [Streptomyces sp. NBC_00536]WUC77809.1 helix-turn-helix transcriptional regulator [Streptomyces sp. NBC_00536]
MSPVAALTRTPAREPALEAGRLSRMLAQVATGLAPAPEPAPDTVEMPYPDLVRLLGGHPSLPPARPVLPAHAPHLTARQTSVLALMAEGHGNAVIARTLSCSEHTVKNVIYELMSRLHARNRSHAVACAVQYSLI